MKLKIYYSLIAFLVYTIQIKAQVNPGYQGKHFLLNLNYSSSIALKHTKNSKMLPDSDKIRLNHRFETSLVYTFQRQLAGVALYDRFTTAEAAIYTDGNIEFDYLNKIVVNSMGIGLEWTYMSKEGGISPMGHVFSAYFKKGNAKVIPHYTTEEFKPTLEQIESFKFSYNFIGLKYFFRAFLADGITYNIGFNTNIPMSNSLNESPSLISNTYKRINSHSAFYAQFGLGYFLF